MKSCLGLFFSLFILFAVIGSGALIWHLCTTSSFSLKPPTASAAP